MQRNRGKKQNEKDQKSLQETEDVKGIFHTKMGIVKDRNGKDLTEAEDIKKRRQEYTEGLYKKSFNDLDNRSHPILNEERWFLCTLFLFISFDSAQNTNNGAQYISELSLKILNWASQD